MTIDIEYMLRRVVDDVFSEAAEVAYSPHPKYPQDHRALVTSAGDEPKRVEIRATYEWFTADIPALGVGTIVFEYDDDENEKGAALRELALVMRAYLRNEERVGFKRSLFGLRERPFVTINSDGKQWVLSRRTSSTSTRTIR